eukprot:jgi/Astpho2/2534/Aster-04248
MQVQMLPAKGGGKDVAKEIRFADKPQYLPWRPRRYNADKQLTLYVGIGQALLLAWAVLTPMSAGNQPTVASSLMGAVFNSYKLNQIFPTSSSASEEEKKKGLKNIVRGCLLAVMATFAGCFLLYTFPDAIASQLGKQLPYMFYERQLALWSINSEESLNVLSKLLRNTAVSPTEAKYRKIRLSNPTIARCIRDEEGAVETLQMMGWVLEEDGEILTLPEGTVVTMKEVRAVEDAKDRLKKEQRFKARNSKSVSQATNSEKEIIRAQMEADRQERLATQQPVTQASTAQQLNGRVQIRSAGDLGLNAG